MAKWTAADIPDFSGRTVVVTGGNSGIGFEAARELARRGAQVILACRNPDKGSGAAAEIQREQPAAKVEARVLDLASLASVREFAEALLRERPALDRLVNNAGVMAIPRQQTADGFEMQLGTNHLGHFALTGLLLERLLGTPGSRVVNLSSTAHKAGRMDFDDLMGERRYGSWRSYGQSKLANLLFTYELQRRLARKGAETIAVACHPGYAVTNLQAESARQSGSALKSLGMRIGNALVAQDARMGALPTLHAAAAPGVHGGEYYGPGGLLETRGHPERVASSRRSHDEADAARLWSLSEELTGVRMPSLD